MLDAAFLEENLSLPHDVSYNKNFAPCDAPALHLVLFGIAPLAGGLNEELFGTAPSRFPLPSLDTTPFYVWC
jgi:hypothetical protein